LYRGAVATGAAQEKTSRTAEVLLAAVMLVSIYVMIRLASRIYAGALIHSGARLGWRAALRLRTEAG
jgi:hypothetical protein